MIRFSAEAEDDLRDIVDWIRADRGLAVARRTYHRISAAIMRLGQFPASGRKGRIDGTFELVIPGLPYMAVYETEPEGVVVLRVIHGASDWAD